MKRVTFILILLLSFSLIKLYAQSPLLEKGNKLINQGKDQEALALWTNSVVKKEGDYTIEPDVALAFIEYVCKEHKTPYYATATTLYYAGIRALKKSDNDKIIQSYLKHIELLTYDKDRNQLYDVLNEGLDSFSNYVYHFWKSKDPIVSTLSNERLIEHYERIAFAQKEFTKSLDPFFKTDPRGLRYIALGPPDKQIEETIRLNRGDIHHFVNRLNTYFETLGKGGVEDKHIDFIINKVLNAFNHPKVEVWKYYNNEKFAESVFIFGKSGGNGKFKELEGLEELIPDRAYINTSGFYDTAWRMNPAVVLQYCFNQYLSNYDDYFTMRTFEVYDAMEKPNFDGTITSRQIKNQSRIKSSYQKLNAPPSESSYTQKMLKVKSSVHSYRFLTDNNEPSIDVVIDSYSDDSIMLDLLFDSELRVDDYELATYMKLISSKGILKNTYRNIKPIVHYADNDSSILPNRTIFSFGVVGIDHIILNNELKNKKATKHIQDSIFPTSVRAVEEQSIEVKDPLETALDKLVISDIVVGAQYNDSDHKYPFIISPENTLPVGENLNVYLEVYHLMTNRKDEHQFKLSYMIRKKGFLGIKRDLEDDLEVKLNYNGNGSKAVVNLEIDLREMSAGEYTFDVKIEDTIRNTNTSKSIDIKLVDSKLTMKTEE